MQPTRVMLLVFLTFAVLIGLVQCAGSIDESSKVSATADDLLTEAFKSDDLLSLLEHASKSKAKFSCSLEECTSYHDNPGADDMTEFLVECLDSCNAQMFGGGEGEGDSAPILPGMPGQQDHEQLMQAEKLHSATKPNAAQAQDQKQDKQLLQDTGSQKSQAGNHWTKQNACGHCATWFGCSLANPFLKAYCEGFGCCGGSAQQAKQQTTLLAGAAHQGRGLNPKQLLQAKAIDPNAAQEEELKEIAKEAKQQTILLAGAAQGRRVSRRRRETRG